MKEDLFKKIEIKIRTFRDNRDRYFRFCQKIQI